MKLTRELHGALHAIQSAATLCQRVQRAIVVGDAVTKHDRSPVTLADFGSQAIVCRALSELFPDDPVIGEEDSAILRAPENKGLLDAVLAEVRHEIPQVEPEVLCDWIDRGNAQSASDRFWTLDPIDGTKGFLRKEQYAVALALIVGGEVRLAILGCPNLVVPLGERTLHGAILYAVKGEGSRIVPCSVGNDEIERDAVAIHVREVTDVSHARLCESFESSHSSHEQSMAIMHELGMTTEPLRFDSQAKYGAVASGMADIYFRVPTKKTYQEKIWDHAAGVLIVAEAGGVVSDLDGKPLDFMQGRTMPHNRGILATTAALHSQVLSAIRTLSL